mmetsp:Transcript_34112/g.85568  ORF Transcript_34112/g.85568 Transcript_34112/m.85568 type:complete len:261 (+) Transcript_34112:819-1601(+)
MLCVGTYAHAVGTASSMSRVRSLSWAWAAWLQKESDLDCARRGVARPVNRARIEQHGAPLPIVRVLLEPLDLHAALRVAQEDYDGAHHVLAALDIVIAMPAEAGLRRVLEQRVHQSDLHVRRSAVCQCQHIAEFRQNSQQARQHAAFAAVQDARVLGLLAGVVLLGGDIAVCVPAVKTQWRSVIAAARKAQCLLFPMRCLACCLQRVQQRCCHTLVHAEWRESKTGGDTGGDCGSGRVCFRDIARRHGCSRCCVCFRLCS